MFSGCGTALVTPFRRDFSLDETTLKKLVVRQIEAGIDFLSPCGTTGENPTLTREEHLRVVEITVAEAQGRVPVMAGAGGYSTAEIIALAKDLESLHVAGILSVAPYYNRPTQEGLYRHFKAIAEAVSIPVIIYNVPRRTGVNVEPETLVRLSEIEQHHRSKGGFGGYKPNGGNHRQGSRIVQRIFGRRCHRASADCARWSRAYFRGFERNTRRDDEPGAASPEKRFCRGAPPATKILATHGSKFSGNESVAGESGHGRDGIARARLATAFMPS